MANREFLIEEYKSLYKQIETCQAAYQKWEILAFGGVLPVYGFLFHYKIELLPLAWWFIPILIAFCAARAGSYYYVVNFVVAKYISEIERTILFSGPLRGFQTRLSKAVLGRWANIGLSLSAWAAIFLMAVAASWHGPGFVATQRAKAERAKQHSEQAAELPSRGATAIAKDAKR